MADSQERPDVRKAERESCRALGEGGGKSREAAGRRGSHSKDEDLECPVNSTRCAPTEDREEPPGLCLPTC